MLSGEQTLLSCASFVYLILLLCLSSSVSDAQYDERYSRSTTYYKIRHIERAEKIRNVTECPGMCDITTDCVAFGVVKDPLRCDLFIAEDGKYSKNLHMWTKVWHGCNQTGVGDYLLEMASNLGSAPRFAKCKADGWMVILSRFDGSLDFNRNWTEYKTGFGSVDGEYWLGNEPLHQITSHDDYELVVTFVEFSDYTTVDELVLFRVGSEDNLYILTCKTEDKLSLSRSDGFPFSTWDNDNDNKDDGNCADLTGGGWWYIDCGFHRPTGLYPLSGSDCGSAHGNKNFYCAHYTRFLVEELIKEVEMKIRIRQ